LNLAWTAPTNSFFGMLHCLSNSCHLLDMLLIALCVVLLFPIVVLKMAKKLAETYTY